MVVCPLYNLQQRGVVSPGAEYIRILLSWEQPSSPWRDSFAWCCGGLCHQALCHQHFQHDPHFIPGAVQHQLPGSPGQAKDVPECCQQLHSYSIEHLHCAVRVGWVKPWSSPSLATLCTLSRQDHSRSKERLHHPTAQPQPSPARVAEEPPCAHHHPSDLPALTWASGCLSWSSRNRWLCSGLEYSRTRAKCSMCLRDRRSCNVTITSCKRQGQAWVRGTGWELAPR